MAYRSRRSNKGRKCVRKKLVRMRGGKMVKRCAKYGPTRKRKAAKRRATKRRAARRRAPARRRYKGTRRYTKRGARGYRPRSGGQPVYGPFTSSGHFYS